MPLDTLLQRLLASYAGAASGAWAGEPIAD